MAVHRRDGEGKRQVGPTWESLVERQIREAIDAGKFDDLPFEGRPLPYVDDAAAGEWAMAHGIMREAGAAPPWIEADKEVRRLLAERDALLERAPRASALGRMRARAALVRIVDGVDRAVLRLNDGAPTLRQHRRPLDLDAEMRGSRQRSDRAVAEARRRCESSDAVGAAPIRDRAPGSHWRTAIERLGRPRFQPTSEAAPER